MTNNVYLIVGKSGSGKSYVCSKLTDFGYKSVVSYTTRPKRFDNEEGHIFVSKEEFDLLENKCAYTLFNGFEYCATQSQVDDCDLYIIDPKGIEYFKKAYKGNKSIKIIYIKTPTIERIKRMIKRGDGLIKTISRLLNDRKEFNNIQNICDFSIINSENSKYVSIDRLINILNYYIDMCEKIYM